MAKMYKRQEKALLKWWNANGQPYVMTASDLPDEVYWSVYAMHPHENFDSNVMRFLWDAYNEYKQNDKGYELLW